MNSVASLYRRLSIRDLISNIPVYSSATDYRLSGEGLSLVLRRWASKETAGSTKNGHDSLPKNLGVKWWRGMSKLKFKPAYNPYSEPSVEIFSYHEGLKKWVEIGNSGTFRPEMLQPMGLPEDVQVIAWGLSLERPTMILYGIDNIRDLFGHKVDLSLIKRNPICHLRLS